MRFPSGKEAWMGIQALTTLAVIIAYVVIGAVLSIDTSTITLP